MQHEHADWLNHNFPQQQPHDALLGITEEVGELSHVHLKEQQGIRQIDGDNAYNLKCDALGDLFIYMMSYCNTNHIDLQEAIESTWERVKQRDWVVDPVKGGE